MQKGGHKRGPYGMDLNRHKRMLERGEAFADALERRSVGGVARLVADTYNISIRTAERAHRMYKDHLRLIATFGVAQWERGLEDNALYSFSPQDREHYSE